MRRLQFIHSGLTLSPEVKPNQKVEVSGVVKMAAQMKFNAWRHFFRQEVFIREIAFSLPIIQNEVMDDGKSVVLFRGFI